MKVSDWKLVRSDQDFYTYVLKVTGGWLVKTETSEGGYESGGLTSTCVFVPDKAHKMRFDYTSEEE